MRYLVVDRRGMDSTGSIGLSSVNTVTKFGYSPNPQKKKAAKSLIRWANINFSIVLSHGDRYINTVVFEVDRL